MLLAYMKKKENVELVKLYAWVKVKLKIVFFLVCLAVEFVVITIYESFSQNGCFPFVSHKLNGVCKHI